MIDFEEYNSSKLLFPIDFSTVPIDLHFCKINEQPVHFHDCLEIIYILDGELDVKISYDRFKITAGEFVVVNPYDLHSMRRCSTSCKAFYIHFEEGICTTKNEILAWDQGVLKKREETYYTIVESLKQIIRYVCIEPKIEQACTFARNIGMLLRENYKLSRFSVVREHNDCDNSELRFERMENILQYMYAHCDEKITLEKVSDEFNINKFYLAHVIKESMGISFKDMLNLVRVDRAERYVLDKGISINDIIYLVGFSSPQYFNKCFKQYFELTPALYRKKYIDKTIICKSFDEDACAFNSPDIYEFLNISPQSASDIFVSLKNGDYTVTVMEGRCGKITGKTVTMPEERALNIDFEDDELVIIIHRKN